MVLGPLQHYFERVDDLNSNPNSLRAKCKICLPIPKFLKFGAKSNYNLKSHLKTVHPAHFKEYELAVVKKKFQKEIGGGGGMTESPTSGYEVIMQATLPEIMTGRGSKRKMETVPTQQMVDQSVINYLVNDMRPVSTVESESFQVLVSTLAPNKVAPSRFTVIKSIDISHNLMVKKMDNIFKATKYVSTTADLWSCRNRSYLGVTIHYIDEVTLERCSYALACKQIKGQHSYMVIANELQILYNQFKISSKITKTTTDNGSDMVKAFKDFSSEFKLDAGGFQSVDQTDNDNMSKDAGIQEDEDIEQHELSNLLVSSDTDIQDKDGDHQLQNLIHLPPHQQCASHTLNLVATVDFEKGLVKSQCKTLYKSAFGKCCKLWSLYSRSTRAAELIRDAYGHALLVPTNMRWNSWFKAIQKIMTIPEETFIDIAINLQVPPLLQTERQLLSEYLSIMQPISFGLDILQGEKNSYLGFLLPTIVTIRNSLEEMKPKLKYAPDLANVLLNSLATRFGGCFQDREMILATVTIPQFRLDWTEDRAEEQMARTMLCEEIETMARDCFHHENNVQEDAPAADGNKSFFNFKRQKSVVSKPKSEVHAYLSHPSTELAMLNNFPLVKEAFLRYNSTLPSSAPVERLFSNGKLILAHLHNRLEDCRFEKLLLLKCNKHIM